MTSQVAVFNQLGVAIASDTIMTVTSTDLSMRQLQRTFSNRSKLYEVGPGHRIVIAQSGAASVNGLDVTLLLAEWASACIKPLSTVPDYVTHFREWLAKESSLLTIESEINCASNYITSFLLQVRERIESIRNGANSKRAVATYPLTTFLDLLLSTYSNLDSFEGTTDESDAAWIDQVGIDLNSLIDDVFDFRWTHLTDDLETARPKLLKLLPLVLSRIDESAGSTGLAIIGYGHQDRFPRANKIGLRGTYASRSRIWVEDEFTHSDGIMTMAQSDAVDGFTNGASPASLGVFLAVLRKAVAEYALQISHLAEIADELISKVRSESEAQLDEHFFSPLLSTIDCLSLHDLSELSASLVGIQALRANTSPEPPGVGGFIESAVIDRRNGVQWKQKLPT